MSSTTQMNSFRAMTIGVSVCLAIPGGGAPVGHAHTTDQWIPSVQTEWEKYGRKEFQPVAADKPHAMLVFKDVADRTGSGPFDIWVLVDGQRVVNWTASSPLRVAPGAHCIRIDMVSIPARYEGALGKYWPWLPEGFEHTAQLTREAGAYKVDYRPTRLRVGRDLINDEQLKFSRDLPSDGEQAYAYCLKYVTER
jgi:hypothetical protein